MYVCSVYAVYAVYAALSEGGAYPGGKGIRIIYFPKVLKHLSTETLIFITFWECSGARGGDHTVGGGRGRAREPGNLIHIYVYTRNYALAIASASFPLGSHGNPLGITLGSQISKPKAMILDPKYRL